MSGDGFTLNQTTYYKPYFRNYSNKTPSLKCPRQVDQFTVNTSNNLGNGELTYPVGLITADEVSYAGGKYNNRNILYYLNSNIDYWTMSPSSLYLNSLENGIWRVTPSGSNNPYPGSVSYYYIRPVINLKPNTEITSGNGTASSPYQIKYN